MKAACRRRARKTLTKKQLFLNGNLLLDLAPCADFQPAAHPAQRLVGSGACSFSIADRALRDFLETVW